MNNQRRRRASTVVTGYTTSDVVDTMTSPLSFSISKRTTMTRSDGLTFRVVLLGVAGVGKTALTVRYTTRRFIGEYDPTLEYLCRYNTRVDSNDVTMEIQDTAGHDYLGHRSRYAMWGDAFLFVYSITDRDSFEQIVSYKRSIENALGTTLIPGVLVGNKNDLDDDHHRTVSHLEGVELGDELGFPFFEVSAKDGHQIWDVADVFENLFREWTRLRTHLKRSSSKVKGHRASFRSPSGDWSRFVAPPTTPPSPSSPGCAFQENSGSGGNGGAFSNSPTPCSSSKKQGTPHMRKAVNKLILIQRFTRSRFFSM